MVETNVILLIKQSVVVSIHECAATIVLYSCSSYNSLKFTGNDPVFSFKENLESSITVYQVSKLSVLVSVRVRIKNALTDYTNRHFTLSVVEQLMFYKMVTYDKTSMF